MNTNDRQTVSLADAAKRLGVSKSTASRLYRRGLITGYKLTPATNSPLHIYTDSIARYLKALRGPPPE